MPDLDAADSHPPRPSVFLSYASEDREAARLLRDALPGFGLEVWYDESELGGGEAWDQKIRRQIRECDYFMPLVSAQTAARHEGYFRREWRLAVERTLDMADDHPFLLPIVIDDTDQAVARVPEKFLMVQWLKVPGGQPTGALESLCRRLASGNVKDHQTSRTTGRKGTAKSSAPPSPNPEFPREEPGQKIRFLVDVVAWAFRSAQGFLQRRPRWLRITVYAWIAIVVLSRCNSSKHPDAADTSPANAERLKAIAEKYHGSLSKNDNVMLNTAIAKAASDGSDEAVMDGSPLLAIPFTAPAGDAAAQKLADSAFAMVYGTVSLAHHGQVSLTRNAPSSRELSAALASAEANHSSYVLCGTIDPVNDAQVLTVKIAAVADGAVIWSKAYPAAGTDPAKIASDVAAKIPALASDN